MEFASASHALSVRRNNDGSIEAALVGSPGALKEGDLHMHIAVPGELTRQRETWATLYVLSGGVRRALGARIRGVATEGQFGQEHHVGTGTGTSAHALPQLLGMGIRGLVPSRLDQTNAGRSGLAPGNRARAG